MISRAMNLPSTAKTAEIMSRYRPIRPKPELPTGLGSDENGESCKIKQSPYLQSVWARLQARPTRTRKRGRTALAPPAVKRHRVAPFLPVFAHGPNGLPRLSVQSLVGIYESPDRLNLSLPPNAVGRAGSCCMEEADEEGIDLNIRVPEEKDLIRQLQSPVSPSVIAPQPIRPIGSSISVGYINEEPKGLTPMAQTPKKRQEVEDEVELEALPAVVSDTNNKVRLANSAYKEMVGQPECSWLNAMTHHHGSTCKVARICGEVMLQFSHHNTPPRVDLLSSNGFSCWVTIEWGKPNEKNCSVHAFCDVIRLSCESKDYAFEWRFHTGEAKC